MELLRNYSPEHASPVRPNSLRLRALQASRQSVKWDLFGFCWAGVWIQSPASPDLPPTHFLPAGNTVPAVFAIPAASRPGFTGYFIPTPPSSYRSQAWMSYAGENELSSQWADSVRPLLMIS